MVLECQGRTAQLKHPANAHTDGDTYVYFADANVLSTGDTVTIGRYPNIDFANGGSLTGMIVAADDYLTIVNDKTKIVPGHGPIATKAQLAEYRAMLATARDRMAALIKDGKSESDIFAAKPFADLDAKWAANDQAAANFLRVYGSLRSYPPAARHHRGAKQNDDNRGQFAVDDAANEPQFSRAHGWYFPPPSPAYATRVPHGPVKAASED